MEKSKAFTSYLQVGEDTTIEETKQLYKLEFTEEQNPEVVNFVCIRKENNLDVVPAF